MTYEHVSPKTKKITFNCPLKIYELILQGKEDAKYGSITDAILTALRAKFDVE